MPTVPREQFAAVTRDFIEDHSEWDAPHRFVILYRDGDEVAVGSYAVIMPDVHPDQYPGLMARAADDWRESHPDKPAYAYLLQIEAHSVTEPGPDASEAERNQFQADRLGRTFHTRPDAVETAVAWCADVHGRMWTAAKVRSQEDQIQEEFYQPGRSPLGGQMIRGLLAVAYATGIRDHGLPGPQSP